MLLVHIGTHTTGQYSYELNPIHFVLGCSEMKKKVSMPTLFVIKTSQNTTADTLAMKLLKLQFAIHS